MKDIGCFCSCYHSVFSTHRQYWQPPTPLFLVCRSLREQVLEVFFSKNRFIITPVDGHGRAPTTVLDCFEASIFLAALSPMMLSHLRFLEIVFPPTDYQYLRVRQPALKAWMHTIDYIQDKMNLPNITLRI